MKRMIVAGLAATRLVRAWNYELIGEKPREAALRWLAKPVYTPLPPTGMSRATDQVNVRATLTKEWVSNLLECPHCLGFWLTLGCAAVYPSRRGRIVVDALAGAMILSAIVQWFPGFDFEEPPPPDPVEVHVS